MFFEKVFSRVQKSLALHKTKPIYALKITLPEKTLIDIVEKKLSKEQFIELQDINPLESYKKTQESLNPQKLTAFFDSLLPLFIFHPTTARSRLLAIMANAMGYPFVVHHDKGEEIIFVPCLKEKAVTEAQFDAFAQIFNDYFGGGFVWEKANTESFNAIVQQRIEETKNYYVHEHGEWTRNFIRNLQDEISQISFSTFLQQRISATILNNLPCLLPIAPPKKTAAWRKMREQMQFDLPELDGCQTRQNLQYFHLHTFIYEQYAVPGVVEAQPGDVVIDAGAFIGDTACYFSRKVGSQGKIYAFEAFPESVRIGQANMEKNGCSNVEFVPYALSESKKVLTLNTIDLVPSANWLTVESGANQLGQTNISAISLDEYCNEHAIKIDFLKSDIEGFEMELLRGGKNIITRDAPVCAIALYHRREDYWQIPQYLQELVPDYQFWFRCEAEPVLFAKRR